MCPVPVVPTALATPFLTLCVFLDLLRQATIRAPSELSTELLSRCGAATDSRAPSVYVGGRYVQRRRGCGRQSSHLSIRHACLKLRIHVFLRIHAS